MQKKIKYCKVKWLLTWLELDALHVSFAKRFQQVKPMVFYHVSASTESKMPNVQRINWSDVVKAKNRCNFYF